jgi:glutamate-1-semialdehyde 2,1-aminomutase
MPQNKKLKVIAIIQARMGSARLPEKVLADVCGKPMLWHLMRRAEAAKLVDETIIATADNEQNKPIVDFAKKYGFSCYAGSEADLLDRFYQPCKKQGAELVVRLTADCPLVDPEIIDKTISDFMACGLDYLYSISAYKLPAGLDVEVFTMKTLEALWREVRGDFEREWFTTVLRDPARWRSGDMDHGINYSDARWTPSTGKTAFSVPRKSQNF